MRLQMFVKDQVVAKVDCTLTFKKQPRETLREINEAVSALVSHSAPPLIMLSTVCPSVSLP